MRQKLLKLLMLSALVASCRRSVDSELNRKLWDSPRTSSEERVEEVLRVVPKGASLFDAQKLLGTPSRREHWHGPLVQGGSTGKIIGIADTYILVYEFSNSTAIALRFERGGTDTSGGEWHFQGASVKISGSVKSDPNR